MIEVIGKIERMDRKYASCPVCGHFLLNAHGRCCLEVNCDKCSTDVVVLVDDERVIVMKDRRADKKLRNTRCVKSSIARKAISK